MKQYSELNHQESIALFRQSLVNIIESIETLETIVHDVSNDTLADISETAQDYYFMFGDLLNSFDAEFGENVGV